MKPDWYWRGRSSKEHVCVVHVLILRQHLHRNLIIVKCARIPPFVCCSLDRWLYCIIDELQTIDLQTYYLMLFTIESHTSRSKGVLSKMTLLNKVILYCVALHIGFQKLSACSVCVCVCVCVCVLGGGVGVWWVCTYVRVCVRVWPCLYKLNFQCFVVGVGGYGLVYLPCFSCWADVSITKLGQMLGSPCHFVYIW